MFVGRVLVAEDIEGNRQLIELLLSRLGLAFDVIPSAIREDEVAGEGPAEHAERLC